MALKTYIVDGHGSPNRLKINGEGEIGVSIHTHPPLDEEVELYPFAQFFLNGGSNDMRVNGSTTPVDFTIDASPERDIFVKTITVLIADNGADLDEFGALSALTNGIDFKYFNNALGEVVIESGIQTNYDFIRLGTSTHAVGDNTTAYKINFPGGATPTVYAPIIDLSVTFGYPWGLRLRKGTLDKIIFTVNDNLSTGMDEFNIKGFGTQI